MNIQVNPTEAKMCRLTSAWGTVSGFFAVLIWCTAVASMRSAVERLGVFTAATGEYLIAGVVGCLYLLRKKGEIRKVFEMPKTYLFGCGALFIICSTTFFFAIGAAPDRQQVIEVGIVNYLWPSLALIFTAPFLRNKA